MESFVPEDWLTGPLKDFMPLQRGFDLPTSEVVPGSVPVVYSNGIGRLHNVWMVKGPGVVTGRSGTIGAVHFVERDYWPHNTALWVTRFDRSEPRFTYHYLQHLGLDRFASGSGVPTLNRNDAHSFVISIPRDRSERDTIAQALSEADDLVESLERLIVKKQAIKQGMIQALLSGNSRLAGFDAPWTPTAIASLGPLLKGRGVKRDDVRAAGVPCIRYGELYTTFSNYTDTTVSFVDPDVASTALPIAEGDLLFAGSGETKADIGTCVAYVGRSPAVAGGDITVLRAPSVNPVFLASLLNTPQISAMKARWGQGDAVVHISASAIGELQVELPERSEQDAIARLIVDADRDLAAQATLLDVLRNIKQGMMQELLTGRTRLNSQRTVA